MNRRNWGLLILLVILTGTFLLLIQPAETIGTQLAEADRFALTDTTGISKIILRQQGGEQQLTRTPQGWRVNRRYAADPGLMRLLLSVLTEIQVKRSVAINQEEEIRDQLKESGTQVQVYAGEKLLAEFIAGGNATEKRSYFADEKGVYVMELPGYVNYISGIFELSEANLRDRIILEAGYLNLQEAKLAYPERPEDDFSVRYNGQLLSVAEVQQPDSSALFNFLGILEALPVAGFVDIAAYPELDSLHKTQPVAVLEVTTADKEQPFLLEVFAPLAQQPYRLGYLPAEQEAVMLDERLVRALLIRRPDLQLK